MASRYHVTTDPLFRLCHLVGAAPSASTPVEMIQTMGSPRLVDLAKEAVPQIDYFTARSLCINTIANCVSVMWGYLSLRKNVLALSRPNVLASNGPPSHSSMLLRPFGWKARR
jgi:hypothetical protein